MQRNLYFRLFQKDAQRFWPYVLIYLALLAIRLSGDPLYTTWTQHFGRSSPFELLGSLTYVAVWILVAALIHQEAPVGDRQYWLTRPFTWRQILVSKALFVLAFVWAPLFIGHILVIHWLGFPLAPAFPALLMREAIFVAAMVLSVAALASVTRNFARMVLAVIVAFLITEFAGRFLLMMMFSPFYAPGEFPRWGVFDWIPKSLSFVILVSGALSVLLIQYMRRRTRLSFAVGLVTFIAMQVALMQPAGGWAFSVQKHFVQQKVDTSAIQFSMDKERSQNLANFSWNPSNEYGSVLRIPVRVDGLPAGMDLQCAAEQFTVSAVKEGKWLWDWRREGEWSSDYRGLTDGKLDASQPYLLFSMDKEFYKRVKDSEVQITGFIDMILVEHNPVRIHDREYIPGAGVYWWGITGLSLSPWPRAHLQLPWGLDLRNGYLVSSEECAPWPLGISLAPVVSAGRRQSFTESHVVPVAVELVRPVAYVRRSFTFGNLRPQDYFLADK